MADNGFGMHSETDQDHYSKKGQEHHHSHSRLRSVPHADRRKRESSVSGESRFWTPAFTLGDDHLCDIA
ncbi:MAG: hypothetical protein U9P80_01740 [Thermodesulfobacteriota bacterium]|nr:hypothetical protein [Thermodesulfobacteriota bacterium]